MISPTNTHTNTAYSGCERSEGDAALRLASYYNAQLVCCETSGASECNGRPACTSYDPTKGETPCCTAGGYQTCTAQELCTKTGCTNFCTDPTATKDGEPYCSKCNSCKDGILNCGELTLDNGGPNCGASCTMTVTSEFTVSGYDLRDAEFAPMSCIILAPERCNILYARRAM